MSDTWMAFNNQQDALDAAAAVRTNMGYTGSEPDDYPQVYELTGNRWGFPKAPGCVLTCDQEVTYTPDLIQRGG